MNLIIVQIYQTLLDNGFVKSGNQFSREWLGRSDRLYSWLLSTGRAPGIDVMLGLYARLEQLCSRISMYENYIYYSNFCDLRNRLWSELIKTCLNKKAHRKKLSTIDEYSNGCDIALDHINNV